MHLIFLKSSSHSCLQQRGLPWPGTTFCETALSLLFSPPWNRFLRLSGLELLGKETTTFEDRCDHISDRWFKCDRRHWQTELQFRGALCSAGTVCNDFYHTLHQYDQREATQVRLSFLYIDCSSQVCAKVLFSVLCSWRMGISDPGHLTTLGSSKQTDKLYFVLCESILDDPSLHEPQTYITGVGLHTGHTCLQYCLLLFLTRLTEWILDLIWRLTWSDGHWYMTKLVAIATGPCSWLCPHWWPWLSVQDACRSSSVLTLMCSSGRSKGLLKEQIYFSSLPAPHKMLLSLIYYSGFNSIYLFNLF